MTVRNFFGFFLVLLLTLLGVTGCEEKSDNAEGSSQGIEVHCGAALPTGSTTVKVDCPPQ